MSGSAEAAPSFFVLARLYYPKVNGQAMKVTLKTGRDVEGLDDIDERMEADMEAVIRAECRRKFGAGRLEKIGADEYKWGANV
jgi:hypothetical protein